MMLRISQDQVVKVDMPANALGNKDGITLPKPWLESDMEIDLNELVEYAAAFIQLHVVVSHYGEMVFSFKDDGLEGHPLEHKSLDGLGEKL